MAGDSRANKNEPRPPLRVEALPPHWTRLIGSASVVSVERQVPAWATALASRLARTDRQTEPTECRNGVSQTRACYPLVPLPSVTTNPAIGRRQAAARRGFTSYSETIVSACAGMRIVLRDALRLVPSGIVLSFNRLLDCETTVGELLENAARRSGDQEATKELAQAQQSWARRKSEQTRSKHYERTN
jgi:hypothetical protein